MKKKCLICQKEINPWAKFFCSKKCGGISRIIRNKECVTCKKEFKPMRKTQRFCSPLCSWGNQEERFWSKVKKTKTCWLWRGIENSKEYWTMQFDQKSQKPHRISWLLHYGKIPGGLLVCHHCDVRTCVNPKHLFLGTYQDNANDMHKKGRGNNAVGEKHGRSKLTEKNVKEIRSLYESGKYLQRELAEKYGVRDNYVSRILLREVWKHV